MKATIVQCILLILALGSVIHAQTTEIVLAEYTYDDLSRVSQVTLANGSTVDYTYDLANQITQIDSHQPGGEVITYAYPEYDAVGNRLKMLVDSNELTEYTYDELYQLVGVDYPVDPNVAYDYDTVGNREVVFTDSGSSVYSTNALNQYTAVDSDILLNDTNGNLIDDGSLTYDYDSQNRLIQVSQDQTVLATYTYDSAGRRQSKSIPGGMTTVYSYDDSNPTNVQAEYEDGVLARYFVYGPGIDEPICMIEPDGDIYYYHYDGLGSVVALTDANGELVERYTYDAFGKPDQISTVGNPYMFTGRRYDEESGMYYYRARMYHPGLGRFLQTDPIGYEDGVNWYGYCWNNAVNYTDSTGLDVWLEGWSEGEGGWPFHVSIAVGKWNGNEDESSSYSFGVDDDIRDDWITFWSWVRGHVYEDITRGGRRWGRLLSTPEQDKAMTAILESLVGYSDRYHVIFFKCSSFSYLMHGLFRKTFNLSYPPTAPAYEFPGPPSIHF